MGEIKIGQISEKNQQNNIQKMYVCELCSYSTRYKKDFNKHLNTKKHNSKQKPLAKKDKKLAISLAKKSYFDEVQSFNYHICSDCGKKYKHASSLCKHKKKCDGFCKKLNKNQKKVSNNLYKEEGNIVEKKDEMMEMMKLFAETTKNQNEIIKKLAEKNQVNNTYNNCSTNNKMTINLFLNDTCKNAMNLTDFVKNIEVSLEDLEFTSQNGFRKGINNIINKQLQDLQPTERPFHCSDSKRLQFYVKEDDKWEKDVQNKKIDKSIHNVKMKQIEKLFEWQDAHPNYRDNKSLDNRWHEMVKEIMGGSNVKEQHKFAEKIKKSLGKEIDMKEAMENKK